MIIILAISDGKWIKADLICKFLNEAEKYENKEYKLKGD